MEKLRALKTLFTSQYFIFSIILTIKLLVVRAILFTDFNLLKDIILEGSFVLVLLGFVEFFLPKRARTYAYDIANGVLTTVFAGIILYVTYFNTIPTYFALFALGQVSAVSDTVLSLLNPLYLLLYLDILVLVLVRLSKRFTFKTANRSLVRATFLGSIIMSFALFFYYKSVYIANPVLAAENKGILNYELLNLYKNPEAEIKPLSKSVTPKELNEKIHKIKGDRVLPVAERKGFGLAQGRNVIVIQMESFQNFLINTKVAGQEITPHLNKLLGESFYFPNVYQQVGPGNTSDAEFMMNASLYPQAFSPTAIAEGTRDYPSLPKLLKSKGYETMTLHADDIKFWNRKDLYPALGFDHFYQQPLYGDEDVVGLGPSDDVLFTKGLEKLQQAKQPFYAMFVTMTAHNPYKMPEDKQGLALPARFDQSIVGDYLQAQHYTDAAIGRFIEQLKKQGIWQNSVVLVYGDHFGLDRSMLNKQGDELLEQVTGQPYSEVDSYNIPLIISVPGKTNGEVNENIGGQIDFLPTLTNLLGIDIESNLVHFGGDLLNTNNNTIGMRYYMPQGSFINSWMMFAPNTNFEDGTAIQLQTRRNIPYAQYKSQKYLYKQVIELEHLSDAYVLSLAKKSLN